MIRRAFYTLAVCPTLAAAQNIDCTDPVTQTDMNICASRAYYAADDVLNEAYGTARRTARQLDSTQCAEATSAALLLADAQRSWITFRDLACQAESKLAEGGSLQPFLLFSCLERLTRQRAEDLRFFGESN